MKVACLLTKTGFSYLYRVQLRLFEAFLYFVHIMKVKFWLKQPILITYSSSPKKVYIKHNIYNLFANLKTIFSKMDLYLDSRADLDAIFQTIKDICSKYNIPYTVYSRSMNQYFEYKSKLECPQKNGHYEYCVWSKDNCLCGPDNCVCCRLRLRPKQLFNSLLADIGLDLILALVREQQELRNHEYSKTQSQS